MRKMTSFLLSDTEAELMNRSDEEILREVFRWFSYVKTKTERDATISDFEDRRFTHARILYAEGSKLMHTHPEEGHRLMMASIYWRNPEALLLLHPEEQEFLLELLREKTATDLQKLFIKEDIEGLRTISEENAELLQNLTKEENREKLMEMLRKKNIFELLELSNVQRMEDLFPLLSLS